MQQIIMCPCSDSVLCSLLSVHFICRSTLKSFSSQKIFSNQVAIVINIAFDRKMKSMPSQPVLKKYMTLASKPASKLQLENLEQMVCSSFGAVDTRLCKL